MTDRNFPHVSFCSALLTLLLAACDGAGPALPIVGTLERHRLALPAYAAEPVTMLAVREGEQVRAGQVLATLDPAAVDARRAGVAAQVAQAQAQLAELTHGPRVELVLESRQRLAGAQAALVNADAEHRRLILLVQRRLVSRAATDASKAARDQASASVGAARAQLQALQQGTRIEQLDQARAQFDAAQAQLRQLDIERARLTVRAPQNGTIEALPYRPGERPGVGAPVVLMLADEIPFARVYVPEAARAALPPGTAVQVLIDGVAAPQPGRVRFIAREANFTPYFALTQKDRGNLVFVAEIELTGDTARELPVGIPVQIRPVEPRGH